MSFLEMQRQLELSYTDIDGCGIWIWGTGNTSEMFQEGIKRWKRYDQIEGYVDNNPARWGKTFHDKPVISPDQLCEQNNPYVLLCTNQTIIYNEVSKQLDSMNGIRWSLLQSFVLSDLKDEVLKAYEVFDDEKSKDLMEYLVTCKLEARYPAVDSGLLDIADEHGYFSGSPLSPETDCSVFVDVGCYIGDSIKSYLDVYGNRFKRIYAFEPDEVSYKKAEDNIHEFIRQYSIDKDRIRLYPYGVGGNTHSGHFERMDETDGAGSKYVSDSTLGNETGTRIVALDDFMDEEFTLLKADIESYEYQMILGATKCIKKYAPKMIICLYHNTFDFIQIPILLKKINPSYKLYLRQHAATWYDTILYVE